MSLPDPFVRAWTEALGSPRTAASLTTTSIPQSLVTGSGISIFTRSLVPALLSARHEILFVTCFWAHPSPSLRMLAEALTTLATIRLSSPELPPLRIRICFSSRSALQRILHTFSRRGYVYPPSKWKSSLGLPAPDVLERAGITLSVKSLFFNPLGILHPKFILVDRRTAWLPSCNVSWEVWFEGCVEVSGDVVGGLFDLWNNVWGCGDWELPREDWGEDTYADEEVSLASGDGQHRSDNVDGINPPARLVRLSTPQAIPTIILPSSYHLNPHFRPLPFISAASPPTTPLNMALLTLFSQANSSISIITPNITCPAVLDALIMAIGRGVDVSIRTSRHMMVLEQFITAGTTTERCLARLKSKHRQLAHPSATTLSRTEPWWVRVFGVLGRHRKRDGGHLEPDLEGGEGGVIAPPRTGALTIQNYRQDPRQKGRDDEPTASHFKMTLVDGQFLVLGSGNMDRASWYTSQELGILFYSQTGFDEWMRAWNEPLTTRLEPTISLPTTLV